MTPACHYCENRPGRSPEEPFCSFCNLSIKIEVARGLTDIGNYLRRHAAFATWLQEHRAR